MTQPTQGDHTAEIGGPTCRGCGRPIVERYAGTFWKAPDPMPMMWVHSDTKDRACGYAEPTEPHVAPSCDHPGIEHGLFSYTWPCPSCGVCKFIGHGPLCWECYTSVGVTPPRAAGA